MEGHFFNYRGKMSPLKKIASLKGFIRPKRNSQPHLNNREMKLYREVSAHEATHIVKPIGIAHAARDCKAVKPYEPPTEEEITEKSIERYKMACVALRDSRMGIMITEEEHKALKIAAGIKGSITPEYCECAQIDGTWDIGGVEHCIDCGLKVKP